MPIYTAYNGVEPTTAARVSVATGATIKTLLQVATPSTAKIIVIAWGISFNGSAAATPGVVELIETDVAATVTSVTPTKYDDPLGPVSACAGGAALTGFTATAEGTITAVRTADAQFIAPTNQFVYEWSLGREFQVPVSKFLRVRATFGTTVNAITWVRWSE